MRAKSLSDVLTHSSTGLLVCPATGEVFKPDGRPAVTFSRSDPYLRVIQRCGQSCLTHYAHRLVWEVVHGSIPEGFHVDHLDGNARNNAISNLEMVPARENHRRQVVRSLESRGYSTGSAKLTASELRAIHETKGVVPTKAWGRRLGVEASAIRAHRNGRWKCLGDDRQDSPR